MSGLQQFDCGPSLPPVADTISVMADNVPTITPPVKAKNSGMLIRIPHRCEGTQNFYMSADVGSINLPFMVDTTCTQR